MIQFRNDLTPDEIAELRKVISDFTPTARCVMLGTDTDLKAELEQQCGCDIRCNPTTGTVKMTKDEVNKPM